MREAARDDVDKFDKTATNTG